MSAALDSAGISVSIVLTPDQLGAIVDAAAERAAAIVAERQATASGDGWVRGAKAIADYIDAKPGRVYALNSAGRIPVEHDGSGLIVRRSVLDAWIRDGGGKRP